MAVCVSVFMARGADEGVFFCTLRIDFPEMKIESRPFSATIHREGCSLNLFFCRNKDLVFSAIAGGDETDFVPGERYGFNHEGIDHGVRIWTRIYFLVEEALNALEEKTAADPSASKREIFVEAELEDLVERDHEVLCLMCRRTPPVLIK